MAFTRNYLSSWILDHSKFKTQPSYVRGLMDDIGERLAAYLYGFTTTETFTGFKQVRLITIGTGSGNTPTGTGVQAAINLEGRTIDGEVELITIDADGNEIQFTSKGAFLANNAWLTGNKYGTGGNMNIIRINTANQLEISTGFGTHLLGPDTGPTTALQYAPKGYVDNKVTVAINTAVNGIADGTTISINTGTQKLSVGKPLGAWVDKSASYGAQQAATDGFVLANAQNASLYIYTDVNADPTTLRVKQQADAGGYIAVMCPVKKGDYWKITYDTSAPTSVYWIPLGS